MLAPMGLRLSPEKTRVVHMSEGFDFLGFHIQWRRKRGTNKWYVYTFIADRPIRSVKAKIRALTHRTSQQDLRDRADPAQPDHARMGQLLPARRRASTPSATWTTSSGGGSIRWLMSTAPLEVDGRPPTVHRPPRAVAADHARTGSSCSTIASVPVTRYRYRGNKIPTPWTRYEPRLTAETVESPVR